MSDFNLNVDLGNVLQPPNLDAISAEVAVKKQGPIGAAKDSLSTSTATSATVNLLSDNPTPTAPTKIGTETLAELGASSATTGPGGPGGLANPWFQANPVVAFSVAFMDYYASLRENKSAMAEVMVDQIGVTMDLAQSSAALVMAAAKKESEQHIQEAIVAGIHLAVAVAGAISTGAQMVKAAVGNKAMEKAKAEMEKDGLETDYKAVKDIKAQQAQIEQNNKQLANMDAADKAEGRVSTAPSAERTAITNNTKAIQKEMAKNQNDLTSRKVNYEETETKYEAASKRFEEAKANNYQEIERNLQMVRSLSEVGNNIGNIYGSLTKAELSILKGKINAAQQILQGQQEIMKRVSDTITESYRSSSDGINQLLQALKKMEDEVVRAMSMTRN